MGRSDLCIGRKEEETAVQQVLEEEKPEWFCTGPP
jgi:hypothetical protein